MNTKLKKYSGLLSEEEGEFILKSLEKKKLIKDNIMGFAGAWKDISEEEAKRMKETILERRKPKI